MNDTEIHRLAQAANALRPDWPTASVRTWLERNHADRAYHDVARALAWIATDPLTRLPARMDEPGPWWPATTRTELVRPQPPALTHLCDEHGRDRATCPPTWHKDQP